MESYVNAIATFPGNEEQVRESMQDPSSNESILWKEIEQGGNVLLKQRDGAKADLVSRILEADGCHEMITAITFIIDRPLSLEVIDYFMSLCALPQVGLTLKGDAKHVFQLLGIVKDTNHPLRLDVRIG